jgi:uncharacterized protein (TIGR01244 family)
MSTTEIYNYRKVNEDLITGGQPTEGQLRAAATEGFTAVINLAPIHPEHPLKDEAGLVQSLGMIYHHIPVVWQEPKESDFEAFESAMQQTSGSRLLIHCAANFRVTAFYSLYAIKNLGWSPVQAREFRESIWAGSDYPVWNNFIGEMETKIAG